MVQGSRESHESGNAGDGRADDVDLPRSQAGIHNPTTVDAESGEGSSAGLEVRCPHCHELFRVSVDAALDRVTCAFCGSHIDLVADDSPTKLSGLLTRIGHFELLERVGMGSFGTVWKARDTKLDRIVALKIPRRAGLSATEKDKFLREARAAAQLSHPGIVAVHEMGRVGDTIYIAADLVRGSIYSDGLTSDDRRQPRSPRWSRKSPRRWNMPTRRASSTATSSRRTSWSMRRASHT